MSTNFHYNTARKYASGNKPRIYHYNLLQYSPKTVLQDTATIDM